MASDMLLDLAGPTTTRNIERAAANLVRLARIRSGMSQRQAAAAAGVPQSTVARIESGVSQPSLPMLCQILIGMGFELRASLAAFDDHDKVLDERAAADPARHAAALAAQGEFLDAAGAAS